METKTDEEMIDQSEDVILVSEEIGQEPIESQKSGPWIEYGEDWNNDSIILEFLEDEKALENENNLDKYGKRLLKAED